MEDMHLITPDTYAESVETVLSDSWAAHTLFVQFDVTQLSRSLMWNAMSICINFEGFERCQIDATLGILKIWMRPAPALATHSKPC